MHILLTNDDGVFSTALWAMENALGELGEVTVVAPMSEQSGIGHAITYRTPIRSERVRSGGTRAHAVEGTPADCVKFALLHLLPRRPDLVVSGINMGLNLGCNIFYSGTVAAAIEGTLYGIRSAAISCPFETDDTPEELADEALRALRLILGHANGRPVAYNVNMPRLEGGSPEIVFTHQWAEAFNEQYLPRQHGDEEHYQLHLPWEEQMQTARGCDVMAVREGRISVTPLRPTLTDMETLEELNAGEPDVSELGT